MSREATDGGNGVEVTTNKPVFDEADPTRQIGVYTDKIYHMEGWLPGWIKAVLPKSAMRLMEQATDKYPHCKTCVTFPFLGDRFELTIESRHALDRGETQNIHGLSAELLKKRHITHMDFAYDKIQDPKYISDDDPTKFKSQKSGLGPLSKGWQKSHAPIMCAYKLVTIRCKVFALQHRLEKFMMDFEQGIFLKFHKQLFCWQDEWWGMTADELTAFESRLYAAISAELRQASPSVPVEDTQITEQQLSATLEALGREVPPGDESSDVDSESDTSSNGMRGSSSACDSPAESPFVARSSTPQPLNASASSIGEPPSIQESSPSVVE